MKGPKLSLLSQLPIDVIEACKKCNQIHDINYGSDTETDSLEKSLLVNKLEQGKNICIDNFLKTLKGDMLGLRGSTLKGFVSSAEKWLLSLKSNSIIHIYEDIRKKDHECNGYVVSTNGVIHNATRSSTNAILLGNHQQSCNSLFYVVPYICKNKVSIESVLVSLERAQLHVEEHPSVAGDTGTDKRTIQYMFAHVINDLSRSMK